jgi:TonB-dependent receptor
LFRSPRFLSPQFALSAIPPTGVSFLTTNLELRQYRIARGAIGKRYHLGSHLSTIEIGGKFRNAHDNSYTPTYNVNSDVSVPLTGFLSTFLDKNYYMNNYQFGPTTNWSKIMGYLNSNPLAFTLDPTTVGVNGGNFDLVEQVSAGYVMDTIDFSKVRVVGGVRIEGTNLNTASFDVQTNALNFKQNGSYINVLPSASVRFDLGHDTNLRAVYSRALSRPDPQDIAQAFSVTLDQVPLQASLGNPALKAETANNYDLLLEHYLKPFGMIQGGFFYKQLYDPIVTETSFKQNYSPDPANGSYPVGTWQVTQPVNAGSGWLYGFEVAYLQHFTFSVVWVFPPTTVTRTRRQTVCRGAQIVPDCCARPQIPSTSARHTIAGDSRYAPA